MDNKPFFYYKIMLYEINVNLLESISCPEKIYCKIDFFSFKNYFIQFNQFFTLTKMEKERDYFRK